jgi:hypothetical protein
MKELATDIAIVVGPASVLYYLIGDPWVAVLWSIVGLSVPAPLLDALARHPAKGPPAPPLP